MMKMRSNFQRVAALGLSFVIALGPLMTVYATESEVMEQPETEMEADKGEIGEITKVILPTSEVDFFDFILDPQELIYKTNAAAYGGKKFEEGATLFFQRFDGKAEEDYTSDSDAVLIANKGNGPVDVEVNASITVTEAAGLAMTDDREFTDDTRASLYLALTDGETTVPITLEEGASICVELLAAAEGTSEDGIYSFWLTGAANKNGDWYGLKDMGIEVTVTWKVTAVEEPMQKDEKIKEEEEADSSTIVPADDKKATPSEADASDVDKEDIGGTETAPEATGSDVEADESRTPAKATGSDADVKPKSVMFN